VRSSLEYAVRNAINSNGHTIFGKKVEKSRALTMEHKEAIQNLVTETHTQIESHSFQPLKYTDPRGGRLFTMVPVYSFQLRHATFNQQTFVPILIRANLFRGSKISQDELRHIIWQNFDMTKIGMKTEASLKTERREFWYV
jgi:hypothetical protein